MRPRIKLWVSLRIIADFALLFLNVRICKPYWPVIRSAFQELFR